MGDSSQRISKAIYIWGQFEDSSLKELTALKDNINQKLNGPNFEPHLTLFAKYHFQFSTLEGSYDNGISFGVSITNKFTTGNPSKNRSQHASNFRSILPSILDPFLLDFGG